MVTGYLPQTVAVTPTSDPYIQDFNLEIDEASCSAPGYSPEYIWYETFEGDNGGFTSGGTASSWAWGVPTSGPGAAHSGTNLWATNLAGDYNNSESSYIISPAIDLSAYAGQTPILKWWQWVETEVRVGLYILRCFQGWRRHLDADVHLQWFSHLLAADDGCARLNIFRC